MSTLKALKETVTGEAGDQVLHLDRSALGSMWAPNNIGAIAAVVGGTMAGLTFWPLMAA
jgi:hypothetical protein